MDAKKYPALTATLVVLGLVALTGVVLAGLEFAAYSKSAEKLAGTDSQVARLLKDAVAPTAENKKAAEDNLAALKSAEERHLKELAGVKTDEFTKELVTDPGQFTANLNSSVANWRKALGDVGIHIIGAKPEDFAFGFSRYFRTGVNPPQKNTQDVSRQSKVVDFLIRSLIEVRTQDDNLRLVAVDREPLELPATNRNFNKDELSGIVDPTFRHEGVVRSEFFRIRFIGKTDVLRRLMNAVSNSGRPVIVRGVDVVPATPEQLAAPQAEGAENAAGPGAAPAAGNIFGDAPSPGAAPGSPDAAPSGPQLVVKGDASDITVTFEYIEPAKPEPVKSPDESGNGNGSAANANNQ